MEDKPMQERDTTKITTIYIHHSESDYGNAELIRKWHTDQGWDDIGYNDIICNCYPTQASFRDFEPDIYTDGKHELGRPIQFIPSGVKGHNTESVHICLIGNRTFSSAQLITLRDIILYYKGKYPSIVKVLRHCDTDERKPECPSLSRKFLKELTR
jgi:N-acetylmuramoyl-L-alanine amidase